MVKNPEILEKAELEYDREHPLSLEEKFELFEQMYQLAVDIGGFRERKSEEDIEEVIHLAKALHGKLPKTSDADSTSVRKI